MLDTAAPFRVADGVGVRTCRFEQFHSSIPQLLVRVLAAGMRGVEGEEEASGVVGGGCDGGRVRRLWRR